MAGINDSLTVVFKVQKGAEEVVVTILKFRDIVARPAYEQKEGIIIGTLYLDRPDTLDEGEINQYYSRIYELKDRLLELEVVIAEEHVAEFHIPKGAC